MRKREEIVGRGNQHDSQLNFCSFMWYFFFSKAFFLARHLYSIIILINAIKKKTWSTSVGKTTTTTTTHLLQIKRCIFISFWIVSSQISPAAAVWITWRSEVFSIRQLQPWHHLSSSSPSWIPTLAPAFSKGHAYWGCPCKPTSILM